MAVTPIIPKQAIKKAAPAFSKNFMAGAKPGGLLTVKNKYAHLALPTGPKKPNTNILDYLILLYGREKIGKSKICASFPNAIFFTTEPGTKGLPISEFNHEDGACKDWEIIRRGVELLEKNKGIYKTVIIDTVDRAYDMCLDYVCTKKRIEYPGADSSGKEDFGKSWRAVKIEFIETIHRLAQAGYGIVFTSHATENEIKKSNGDKYTVIHPSMSGQARKVVEAIVDLFFYAEYVRAPDGSVKRIWICEGDDTIWAGARQGVVSDFPKFLPMEKENGFEIIKQAFEGAYPGLDPKTFLPSRQTTKTGGAFLAKAKTRAAVAKV